jgi:hypothetical protein
MRRSLNAVFYEDPLFYGDARLGAVAANGSTLGQLVQIGLQATF